MEPTRGRGSAVTIKRDLPRRRANRSPPGFPVALACDSTAASPRTACDGCASGSEHTEHGQYVRWPVARPRQAKGARFGREMISYQNDRKGCAMIVGKVQKRE